MKQEQPPITISQYIGRRVRTLRKAQNISQEKLAERADLSESIIRQIEKGAANPTLDTLHRLAGCLGTETSDLLPAQREKSDIPLDLAQIDGELQDMPSPTREFCLHMFYSFWEFLKRIPTENHLWR